MPMPDKETLERMYCTEKISPSRIAASYHVTQRTVYNWFRCLGIISLGPTHLRKGKPATWNIGLAPSPEAIAKNRAAHLGKIPHNLGVGRIEFTCEVCGKAIFDKPYRRKRVCSTECRDKRNSTLRGARHWNYKGDDTGKVQKTRHWSQYREWHAKVLKAGSFTCAKCRKVGGRLTAHHINNWAKYPHLRFEVSNGAVLCWKCHWAFHRAFGHLHTTFKMFAEYLHG